MRKWSIALVVALVAVIILSGCQGVRCAKWGTVWQSQYNYQTKTSQMVPTYGCVHWVAVPDAN